MTIIEISNGELISSFGLDEGPSEGDLLCRWYSPKTEEFKEKWFKPSEIKTYNT